MDERIRRIRKICERRRRRKIIIGKRKKEKGKGKKGKEKRRGKKMMSTHLHDLQTSEKYVLREARGRPEIRRLFCSVSADPVTPPEAARGGWWRRI